MSGERASVVLRWLTRRAGRQEVRRPGGRGRLAGDAGQASIELLALVPLLVVIALAALGLLAGQAAREAADQGAVAAAMAALQGGDPRHAASEAAPGWSDMQVRVVRGAATVEVRPRLPRAIARAVDARRTVVFSPGGPQR